MKSCKNCNKKWLCEKKKDNICEDYEKEPYTKIVSVDGIIKKIERID